MCALNTSHALQWHFVIIIVTADARTFALQARVKPAIGTVFGSPTSKVVIASLHRVVSVVLLVISDGSVFVSACFFCCRSDRNAFQLNLVV